MNADAGNDLSFDQLMELERRAEAAEASAAEQAASQSDDEAELVLPWWQHPINILTMVVTAALLAGMIGWMIGDSDGAEHSAVDTGFLQDMRVHHEQAVYMSSIYMSRPDIDNGLAIVAGSIIQGQTLEVGRMIQLLRDFGEAEAADLTAPSMTWMDMSTEPGRMPGMASDEDLERLETLSGADADQLFADLMITHHEGGIHMAEYAVEHAKSAEVRAMAQAMVTGQQSEVAEVERELAS